MAPTRLVVCSGDFIGDAEGEFYSDEPGDTTASSTKIVSLKIGYGPCLRSIQVNWSDGTSVTRGEGGQTTTTFVLLESERITQVEVTYPLIYGNPFRALRITTNRGRTKQFGAGNGGCSLDPRDEVPINKMSVMGLFGFQLCVTDEGITGLSAFWAEHIPNPVVKTTTKYEPILGTNGHSTPGNLAEETGFTRLLMSPMVTLKVGHSAKTFYTHEETLCKLPFFRAALKGSFEEAIHRAVNLPEDDPAAISALIEFLATGAYSYAFRTIRNTIPQPPARVDESVFHVGVYTVAHKYDCHTLAADAKRNFREVMKEVSGPNIVRAWVAAYGAGMRVQENWGSDGGEEDGLDARVLKLVKQMLTDDEDEIDRAVREVPGLGIDLLKIAVNEACKD